jgi:hypothetical protein
MVSTFDDDDDDDDFSSSPCMHSALVAPLVDEFMDGAIPWRISKGGQIRDCPGVWETG